jgi:hypothetical protein
MFQTCGSATLSESGSTLNAREGSDEHPRAALPLLPRDRYWQAWAVSPAGKPRDRCRTCLEGCGRTLLLDYASAGPSPAVQPPIVEMAMHASGMRETARVLHGSPSHGDQRIQKKAPARQAVHHRVWLPLQPEPVEDALWRADALEGRRGRSAGLDARRRYGRSTAPPRWRWHAIEPHPGQGLA